jgi:hypothetical protein
VNNLYEYGLGGNPTNRLDRGTLPVFSKINDVFYYSYPRRTDDANITYTVETTTNLASGAWTNDGYTFLYPAALDENLEWSINEIDTTERGKFIRLKIEQ